VERQERRISAEGEGLPIPGLLASYAAGAVQPGRTPAVTHSVLRRSAILARGATASTVRLGAANGCIEYLPAHSAESDAEGLAATLRGLRAALEVDVVRDVVDSGCDLVILDGRLPPNLPVPVVGLIKTPHILPGVVTKHFDLLSGLRTGERSPVFVRRRSDRAFFSWFVCLRTPSPFDLALSGLALLEMDAPRELALHTADVTAAVLPRFTSEPFQDDRAPQNLRPVAALERELRHRLGDPIYIHRLLMAAFATEAPTWNP
jgi:hypothetical protein